MFLVGLSVVNVDLVIYKYSCLKRVIATTRTVLVCLCFHGHILGDLLSNLLH